MTCGSLQQSGENKGKEKNRGENAHEYLQLDGSNECEDKLCHGPMY